MLIAVRDGWMTSQFYADSNLPPQYQTVLISEFQNGRADKEAAYWSESFEAPEWRSQRVEKA